MKPILNRLTNDLELLGKEILKFDKVGLSKEFELHNVTTDDLVIVILKKAGPHFQFFYNRILTA